MSAVSVQRVRDSPFRESEWDRRLDDMLEDLGTGGSQGTRTVTQTQQFSSSTSQQMSYSSQQGTRTQSASQQSQSVQRSVTGAGGQQQHFQQQQQQRSQQGNFALTRGPSGADLAEGTLRDLEDGLEKSTRYIQDSNREVGGGFNLEQQVQHMIPQAMQQRQQTSSSVQQQKTQQQSSYSQNVQQQQYNQVYKVQSNQYSGSGERITGQQQQAVEDDERPGSRLKQNIDELDTLLYDLNNARNLSPETAEYGTTAPSSQGPLDSDDYDETVGTTGHVKRTVSAFNEYTSQQGGKPPSPSPRRKPSPTVVRKTPPTSPTRMHQNSATSYQQQQQTSYTTYANTNNSYNSTSYNQSNNNFGQEERTSSPYQPLQGPPGSYQPFSYTETTDSSRGGGGGNSAPPRSPSPQPTAVPFPSSSARPPTPQMPPKRVEELMSEFHEFDSTHGGSVSPTPAPFSVRPAGQPRQHGHVTVTELEDEPPKLQPSPPRKPAPSTPGPDVYYPPEFTNTSPPAVVATQEVHPVADGGSLALERKSRRERERRREEVGDKQGAAVIPICLPLCCAAPCVIM